MFPRAPIATGAGGAKIDGEMSMALLVGFITAYPMNLWLISRHMKHGMMTVRSPDESAGGGAHKSSNMDDAHSSGEPSGVAQRKTTPSINDDAKSVSNSVLVWMTILSFYYWAWGYLSLLVCRLLRINGLRQKDVKTINP
jgi:hypothetical protein